MSMLLPKGLQTLQHWVTGSFSRPDNVFGSIGLEDIITKCDVLPQLRPPKTDHIPIGTILNITKQVAPQDDRRNFRLTDWGKFNNDLQKRLSDSHINWADDINTEVQFNDTVETLTKILQDSITTTVPLVRLCPSSKRWWTTELTRMKKEGNKLSRLSYKYRALPNHEAHNRWKEHQAIFAKQIAETKKQHWMDFLEEATECEMWIANNYIKNPTRDGGRPRIPSLKKKHNNTTSIVTSNEDKAKLIAKSFFPSKPTHTTVPTEQQYPEPLEPVSRVTIQRIKQHMKMLASYKAPGLDGIPNIVLQEAAELIAPILSTIFNAALQKGWYHQSWKESITCVLKKPGKPDYQLPKAYRPIALLSTMAKLMSAIIAEDMSYLIETNNLLPNNHFRGRPGRTTTDALHYLTAKINKAWQQGKVVSVLFLDVEGAFPNAVTERVIHNMRMRRIPEQYIKLIANMLEGRQTKLRFDDFLSTFIAINNGIGQGCPLSMIIYILYNADLIEIPDSASREDAIGYVDDAILIAIGNTFDETVKTLQDMMERNGGAFEWSENHNSNFEMSKVAVMHLSRRIYTDPGTGTKSKLRNIAPPLILRGDTITVVEHYKYLGILIDAELRWTAHSQRTTEKALKWVMMFKRLTRPSTGIRLSLMRQLYISVGIPKMTYGLDIWYTPPHKNEGKTKNSGSVAATKAMSVVQKVASLAITGAMRSTASDVAEAHANIPCMAAMLRYMCHRAMIRCSTLPRSHPNYHIINRPIPAKSKPNEPQITKLMRLFQMKPTRTEKIKPFMQRPAAKQRFSTTIDTNRDATITYETASQADIKIYTDGSGYKGGIGAAAVMYKKGRTEPTNILRYYLGESKEHSTYEAEITGLILATHMIKKLDESNQANGLIEVYTDCQSVIQTSTEDTKGPGQHLYEALRNITNSLKNPTLQPTRFNIRWISAHSNVTGNERADKEAKAAAQKQSTAPPWLPKKLTKPIPMSASSLRQQAKQQRTENWRKWWNDRDKNNKKRREAIDKIDAEFPHNLYHKIAKSLDRNSASLLMQLRTGHIPLRANLHRMRLEESPYCQKCPLRLRETIEHLTQTCPAYEEQQKTLKRTIYNRGLRHPRKELTDIDKVKAILTFIRATGRWSTGAAR